MEAHELELIDQALVPHPRLRVLRVLRESDEVVGEDVRVHLLTVRVGRREGAPG